MASFKYLVDLSGCDQHGATEAVECSGLICSLAKCPLGNLDAHVTHELNPFFGLLA